MTLFSDIRTKEQKMQQPDDRQKPSPGRSLYVLPFLCLNLMHNVKIHILSIKKHKERERKTAYLCHVGKWIP